MSDAGTGGVPARRAVTRWAWRLFRRDWRQHLLIISLLSVAVAAAIGLACAAFNAAPAGGRADFGDADHWIRFDKPDPATLQAKLDAATEHFGVIDAIGHRPVPVPGTTRQVDYRSQQPDGTLGAPLLELRSGRYPSAGSESAVTDWVADILHLAVGSTVDLDGVPRAVVGIVENPSNFDDEFVLLTPSALATSDFVTVLFNGTEDQIQSLRLPDEAGRVVSSRGDMPESLVAAMVVLVVTTVVLLLVALIAAASFTVIAQRRLPQLGMMSAIGATEKHLRLTMVATGIVTGVVSAIVGAVIGLVGWVALAPRMAGAVGYRVDAFNIPSWLIITVAMLAISTATGAAWWPGRAMSRIPTVVALSGRPPRPAKLHRSALLATTLLIGGAVSLAIGGRARESASTIQIVLILTGIVAVLVGVMLIGPIAIRALASCAARVPIASRLALRDLSRYQARSGAALAAIALAIGIPVAIVAATAAAENNLGLGNLPSNQLLIHPPRVEGPFVPAASAVESMQPGVDAISTALRNPTVIPLNVALNPDTQAPIGFEGTPAISLAREVERGWTDVGQLFVASPEILAQYGLTTADIGSDSGILSTERGSDIVIMDVGKPQSDSRDQFEHLEASNPLPDQHGSLPRALINPDRLAERGWESVPSGRWLIQTAKPLTADELDAVRVIAAQYGFSIESRETQQTLANVRLGATAVGMLVALGILAMTVGLIRAESAGEMRTLTATGATSSTRRNINAATAGGLAGLGAVLGISAAYLALTAGHIRHLTPLPTLHLAIITVGTPLAAAVVGWLVAGREPAALARRPIG
jgi:putative ABC transport system permease protein